MHPGTQPKQPRRHGGNHNHNIGNFGIVFGNTSGESRGEDEAEEDSSED